MTSANRWLGLALVAALALVAQPAALLGAPASTASAEDPAPEGECSTLDDLDSDDLDEPTGELVLERPGASLCLEEGEGSPSVADVLDDPGLRLS